MDIKNDEQTFIIDQQLPGLNDIIDAARTHWAVSANQKKDSDNIVMWSIKKHNIKPYDKKIDIHIYFICQDRRRDKDNIMAAQKFILDGMVAGGIIPNDGWNFVGGLSYSFKVDRDNPHIKVTLQPSEEIND